MLKRYLNGANEKHEAALLAGVDPAYAAWLRAAHAAKAPARKEQISEDNRKRDAKLHEEGVVTKQQKTD